MPNTKRKQLKKLTTLSVSSGVLFLISTFVVIGQCALHSADLISVIVYPIALISAVINAGSTNMILKLTDEEAKDEETH